MESFLSKSERNSLLAELRLERYRRYADRIRVVLLLDEGKSAKSIAEYLFLTEKTVRHYGQSYKSGGIEQLIYDDYKGKEFHLTELERTELINHLSTNLYRTTLEIRAYILNQYGVKYTTGGVRHLLKRLGFVYKKPQLIPGKANKEQQQAFVNNLERLKKSKSPLYFADAVHPQHNTYVDRGWILKGQDFNLKSNTKRYRVNVNGAINANDASDVLIDSSNTVNAQSTIKLLKKIERKNPRAKKINVVVDNAMYYRCSLVKDFLKTSKIKLIFLPPYSPNLNLIERLWKVMNRKILYNIYYEKLEEFREAILGFFRNIRRYREDVENILSFKFRILGT